MTTLAVIGYGTMGRAIVTGMLDAEVMTPAQITVRDKRKDLAEALAGTGLPVVDSAEDAVRTAEVVLVCTKPKDVAPLLLRLTEAGALDHRPLVVSIAAGMRLATLEAALPAGTPVVRAMPNTAAAIRVGVTVLSPGECAGVEHVAAAQRLFAPLGTVLELEEQHMDAVTSLSGSGPAFIYVILEALADGGVQCGLPRAVALELAARMTLGAASMVLETGRHPASLKDDVTTPAGSTVAGLLALEDGRIRSVLARGIEEAAKVAAGLGAVPTESAR